MHISCKFSVFLTFCRQQFYLFLRFSLFIISFFSLFLSPRLLIVPMDSYCRPIDMQARESKMEAKRLRGWTKEEKRSISKRREKSRQQNRQLLYLQIVIEVLENLRDIMKRARDLLEKEEARKEEKVNMEYYFWLITIAILVFSP